MVVRPAGKSLTCWPAAGDYQGLKLIVLKSNLRVSVIDKEQHIYACTDKKVGSDSSVSAEKLFSPITYSQHYTSKES